MGNSITNKQALYIIIGIVLLLSVLLIDTYIIMPRKFRSNPVRFCITNITKNGFTKNGRRIEHRFRFLDKTYECAYSANGNSQIKPSTIFIYGFLLENPEYGKVYEDYLVPAHIQDSPPEGWTLEEVRKLDPSFATIELPYQ